MTDHDVYVLTPRGEEQLRGARTTVGTDEIDLLVRVDGILTVGQIRSAMGGEAPVGFERLISRLLERGLLAKQEGDPFEDQFVMKPTGKSLHEADIEAAAGAASLQKTGYFVRIARNRGHMPKDRTPSALVVEDESHLANFLKHYLSFEGFEVRIAQTRDEIVAALRSPPLPDLVLLDVMLPDADGFKILQKMRSHPVFKEVPVIMLTAKATREAVITGLVNGADGYVTKPFEVDALLAAVRTVMGMPEDSAPGSSWSSDPPKV